MHEGVTTTAQHDTTAIYRAIMLAPTISTCEALLRGETVPLTNLDAEWVRRLGLRPSHDRNTA